MMRLLPDAHSVPFWGRSRSHSALAPTSSLSEHQGLGTFRHLGRSVPHAERDKIGCWIRTDVIGWRFSPGARGLTG